MTAIQASSESLWQTLRELEDFDVALKIVDGDIQTETHLASTKLCEAVSKDHSALVTDMARTLSAFHGSFIKYVDFLDSVESTGASVSYLRPVFPNAIGHPRDSSGAFHWAFKEFRENGHIGMKDIPEAVQ